MVKIRGNECILHIFSYRRFQISSRNSLRKYLQKEKIGRQLVAQLSSTPFMNIRDGYNSKKSGMFDIQDRLDDKIDKLTSMMSKLTAQGSNQNKPFKPKIYQGKRRGQTRNYYDQGNYQNINIYHEYQVITPANCK